MIERCRKCDGEMHPGVAITQTFTGGAADFPGDDCASTFSAGGPGELVDVMKCSRCGWSVQPMRVERDAAWNDAIEAAAEVVEAERAERKAGAQTDGLWTAAQKIRALRKGGNDGR